MAVFIVLNEFGHSELRFDSPVSCGRHTPRAGCRVGRELEKVSIACYK